MADETTNSQTSAEIAEQLASDNEQAQETSEDTSSELNGIPEKFAGKGPMEIAQSYVNLEKQMSKISSERATERKNREDLETRYRSLESTLQVMQLQLSQQPQHRQVMEQETDPLSDYEKSFDEDPKTAIKNLTLAAQRSARQHAESIAQSNQRALVMEYHERQTKDNPEYKELLPKMRDLAAEYNELVSADKAGSVKALKLLHLAALGATREQYAEQAISKAKKEGDAIRKEKRGAFSETSQSTGDGKKVDFANMTSAEMAKYLPRAD